MGTGGIEKLSGDPIRGHPCLPKGRTVRLLGVAGLYCNAPDLVNGQWHALSSLANIPSGPCPVRYLCPASSLITAGFESTVISCAISAQGRHLRCRPARAQGSVGGQTSCPPYEEKSLFLA